MVRKRALKVLLVLVGLLFSAGAYPAIGGLFDPVHSDTGDTMQMAIYASLGVFLLMAVRNPASHRSLIAFTPWSSFAHAAVMSTLGFEIASQRAGFLIGSAVLVLVGGGMFEASKRNVEKALGSQVFKQEMAIQGGATQFAKAVNTLPLPPFAILIQVCCCWPIPSGITVFQAAMNLGKPT